LAPLGNVDINVPGVYSLVYRAQDLAGNLSEPVTITVTVKPTLSNNANLESIVLQDYSIEFDPNVTEYTVQVPNEVTDLSITYAPSDPTAMVTVSGSVYQATANSVIATLSIGPNEIKPLVTAENGSTKTYTIN